LLLGIFRHMMETMQSKRQGRLRLILALAFGIMAGVSASAQDAASAGTIRLTSRLVFVNVIVRDHSGQVVHGLTQQDFKVEEDGRPQKVDFFEAHSFDQAAILPTAQSATTATAPLEFANVEKRDVQAGAINIILFDLLNTPKTDQLYARKQLLQFVQNLPAGQNVALFVLTDRLHMLQNFTGSSDRLLAAAKAIALDDQGTIRSKGETQQDKDFVMAMARMGAGGASGGLERSLAIGDALDSDHRGHLTIQALGELARATSGYSGRKNLLWLSESFPVSLGAQLEDVHFRSTPDLPEARETANLVADAEVSIYPISLLGLETSGVQAASNGAGSVGLLGGPPAIPTLDNTVAGPTRSAPSAQIGDTLQDQFTSRSALRAALNDLADQTGGEATVGSNDFAGALRRSMLDGSNYYTIAYRPTNEKWNGHFRKIHVELAGKSGSLAYRRGYFATADSHHANDSAQELHFALQPETPEATMLPLRARVRLPDAQHPEVHVDSILDPRNAAFTTTADGKRHAQLLVLLIALNDGEQQAATPPQTSGVLNLDLTPDQYKIAITSGIPLHQDLKLKPGRYRLRLGVSDMTTHDLGTLDMPVDLGR
jgi:VWFA-related protein